VYQLFFCFLLFSINILLVLFLLYCLFFFRFAIFHPFFLYLFYCYSFLLSNISLHLNLCLSSSLQYNVCSTRTQRHHSAVHLLWHSDVSVNIPVESNGYLFGPVSLRAVEMISSYVIWFDISHFINCRDIVLSSFQKTFE
jgi:hypothetical protein